MTKLHVGLIFGGRSEEHEISVMSARSVVKAADPDKYEMIPIGISKTGVWLDAASSRQLLSQGGNEVIIGDRKRIADSLEPFLRERLDVVFPILHGPYGEDGRIQGLFETLDLPYVGAGVMSSAVGMDKAVMKQLFANHNLPQGNYKVFDTVNFDSGLSALKREIESGIGWPCFVKPANLGSSIGISKVHYPGELLSAVRNGLKYDRKVIIEEYIEGREIECSVLGNEQPAASLPGEIKAGHEFYDYDAKYRDETTNLIIPAKLNNEIVEEIRFMAVEAFKAIDGRGLARVDFFVRGKDNQVVVNEINTMPGFTRYSMYPKLWESSGISYRELIDRLIRLALEWSAG